MTSVAVNHPFINMSGRHKFAGFDTLSGADAEFKNKQEVISPEVQKGLLQRAGGLLKRIVTSIKGLNTISRQDALDEVIGMGRATNTLGLILSNKHLGGDALPATHSSAFAASHNIIQQNLRELHGALKNAPAEINAINSRKLLGTLENVGNWYRRTTDLCASVTTLETAMLQTADKMENVKLSKKERSALLKDYKMFEAMLLEKDKLLERHLSRIPSGSGRLQIAADFGKFRDYTSITMERFGINKPATFLRHDVFCVAKDLYRQAVAKVRQSQIKNIAL